MILTTTTRREIGFTEQVIVTDKDREITICDGEITLKRKDLSVTLNTTFDAIFDTLIMSERK